MMNWERHRKGERMVKKMGLGKVEQWVHVRPWVHFIVQKGTAGEVTATYQLNPAMTGGRGVTKQIDYMAKPVIYPRGTVYEFQNYEQAKMACAHTLLLLQTKTGLQ